MSTGGMQRPYLQPWPYLQHVKNDGPAPCSSRNGSSRTVQLVPLLLLSVSAFAAAAGISVCAGGIIGLGEGEEDRVGLLLQLATLPEHPESVPINRLVAVKGTPLQVRGSA